MLSVGLKHNHRSRNFTTLRMVGKAEYGTFPLRQRQCVGSTERRWGYTYDSLATVHVLYCKTYTRNKNALIEARTRYSYYGKKHGHTGSTSKQACRAVNEESTQNSRHSELTRAWLCHSNLSARNNRSNPGTLRGLYAGLPAHRIGAPVSIAIRRRRAASQPTQRV